MHNSTNGIGRDDQYPEPFPSHNANHPSGIASDADVFDTIIVGGGAAGIGAAVGAKQAAPNSSVLVVEAEGCLGGAATHRGVLSYCGLYTCEKGPRQAVGQIWNELHRRLVDERAASEQPDQLIAYVQVCPPIFSFFSG